MKKYIISTAIILTTLIVAWPASGQGQGSEEQGAGQSLSAKEKEKSRAQIRERSAGRAPIFGRQEQLKVIEAVEAQLKKLKAAIKKGPDREAFRKSTDVSPEEQAKLRKEWQTALQEQQQIINDIQEQLTKLERQRAPIVRQDIPLGELKIIHKLAIKENAKQTAERIEELIARYPKLVEIQPEKVTKPEKLSEQSAESGKDLEVKGTVSGKKAPEFTLNSFDGKRVSLSDYKGKIVVLEWFNFECPFVKYHYDTANTMIDLVKKYMDKNVVWLAINSTSHTTAEENKEFSESHKLPYLILDDRSGSTGHAYNATNTPHIFIIDSAGNIAYEGAIDNSPMGNIQGQEKINYVDKALAELIAGKEVSIKQTKPYGCTVKYAK